jgi:hypothetical protein
VPQPWPPRRRASTRERTSPSTWSAVSCWAPRSEAQQRLSSTPYGPAGLARGSDVHRWCVPVHGWLCRLRPSEGAAAPRWTHPLEVMGTLRSVAKGHTAHTAPNRSGADQTGVTRQRRPGTTERARPPSGASRPPAYPQSRRARRCGDEVGPTPVGGRSRPRQVRNQRVRLLVGSAFRAAGERVSRVRPAA